MSSITLMQYAIRKNGSRCERETAERILRLREKYGNDRGEFPMAFCNEGGTGADIEYVNPANNRGAGSWISHQVDEFPNGTKILIQVK